MDVQQHFQAGRLEDAVQAAIDAVKKKPSETGLRVLLAELLCFAGDLERADKHLDAVQTQDPETAVSLSLIRQLVRGETSRREFFRDGRVPEFLELPTEVARMHLQASIDLREGNAASAATLLSEAEEKRVRVHGECDGKPFDDFRDLDDLTSAFFETVTSTGKYYWIPIESVELIEFRPPEYPRDLYWRRCRMVVRGGPDGEVFLPAIYAGTESETDNALKLGRATDWRGNEGEPVRGIGQRTFLVGDEDRPIMELQEITFAAPGS
jgi:type VI secretion system protein ImpE